MEWLEHYAVKPSSLFGLLASVQQNHWLLGKNPHWDIFQFSWYMSVLSGQTRDKHLKHEIHKRLIILINHRHELNNIAIDFDIIHIWRALYNFILPNRDTENPSRICLLLIFLYRKWGKWTIDFAERNVLRLLGHRVNCTKSFFV